MKINTTKIEGLYLIEGFAFSDNRGSLIKPFSLSFFDDNFDENLNFKEVWFTKSSKDVIRAMHLQIGKFACEKLVSVINGAVIDLVLDLRKESDTFGQWFEIELNDVNNYALYIPVGCAHGYKVIKDNTIALYMGTEINVPKDDVGIRWDSFGYNWEIENPILSEKDRLLIEFKDYK